MKRLILASLMTLTVAFTATKDAQAADYVIDTNGAHASILFRVSHLGYSWLHGSFNDFSGTFSYDADNPKASKVSVTIDVTSVDTNHAERDKHLKGGDFFDVSKYPEATFVSTGLSMNADGTAQLNGDFTLRGVTKPIAIDVTKIGEGKDPWGGYRAGFRGTTKITMADYGMTFNLGPSATQAELTLNVEGVRQ